MKHQRLTAFLLSLILLFALLSGCGETKPPVAAPAEESSAPAAEPVAPTAEPVAPEEPADTSITVTDMFGREVTLPKPAESVVVLTAGDCEILYAVGAGDALIARGEYCNYPAEALEITSVSSGSETNIEQILALAPELVIMSAIDQPKEQVDALEAVGMPVLVTNADDIAGTYTAIELIGAVTGHDAEATAVIEDMKTAFAQLSEKAQGHESKSVYFEVSPLEYGLWTAGTNTFMDEICGLLGLTNSFADVAGWGMISEEQVISRNPDVIVTVAMFFGEGPTPEEEICSRAGWGDITAVKSGAILNLQNDELSRPSPRLADGALALFNFVYGE